ncbi:MAG: metallophosphoesterase, partial [Clostridia bacterium]|nr:metallophosphoesterase [Clostridia bacterium]
AFFMFLIELISTITMGSSANLANLNELIDTYKNEEEITQTRFVGEVSDYTWSKDDVFDINDTVMVKKEKDRDFVVLNISDIHFADYEAKKIVESFNEIATIKHLVKTVKPDLIFVLGDNVCKASTVHSIRRITDLFESFGIPWAPIFGNHDDEGNCDLNYLADVMMSGEHCLMRKGDPSMGVGNYIINVAEDNEDGSEKIVESFILMDSHHSSVWENQIQWFKWAANGINEYTNGTAEISLVEHIPIPEYQLAIDELEIGKITGKIIGDGAYGEIHETIACERGYPNAEVIQRGFFDVISESKTTKYVFCGHDHLNNFSVMFNGVRLTYNTKCGTNSGGRFNFNGGTVISINDKGVKSITQKSQILGIYFDYYKICTQK